LRDNVLHDVDPQLRLIKKKRFNGKSQMVEGGCFEVD